MKIERVACNKFCIPLWNKRIIKLKLINIVGEKKVKIKESVKEDRSPLENNVKVYYF